MLCQSNLTSCLRSQDNLRTSTAAGSDASNKIEKIREQEGGVCGGADRQGNGDLKRLYILLSTIERHC